MGMARLSADQAGGKNVLAFLDMLAVSEGTDDGEQVTRDNGYDVIVGGGLFSDYAKHPSVFVRLPKLKIKSSAAGRYQFLKKTWDSLVRIHGFSDFSPPNQDRGAIELIRGRGALDEVKAGHFDEAVALCAKEWASLPGAGYGQHEHALNHLREIYLACGGKLA